MFQSSCQPNTATKHEQFRNDFMKCYKKYSDVDVDLSDLTVELIYICINKLKKGKAAGFDDITVEHLIYAHEMLGVMLQVLFALCLRYGIVPDDFGKGVIIPLVKNKFGDKSCSDNYRGITLSPALSKVFEFILLHYLEYQLCSDELQYGFKKNSSCRNALFVLRSVVEYYNRRDTTVSLCALDISKAFDKVDHFVLLKLLMKKGIKKRVITILLDWFMKCCSCVKWNDCTSIFVTLTAGVRQGGVLSPVLFSIYMDTLCERLRTSGFGCKFAGKYVGCLLYADDIMLLSVSISQMQNMLDICSQFANDFDIVFNCKKSCAMRIGSRFNISCELLYLSRQTLAYVKSMNYLGFCISSGKHFRISLDNAKLKFYRSFNCIFQKTKGTCSEMVTVRLLHAYCLPVLLYGIEAIMLDKDAVKSIAKCIDAAFSKIFAVYDQASLCYIEKVCGCDIDEIINNRVSNFYMNLCELPIQLFRKCLLTLMHQDAIHCR